MNNFRFLKEGLQLQWPKQLEIDFLLVIEKLSFSLSAMLKKKMHKLFKN